MANTQRLQTNFENAQRRPASDLIIAAFGPIVWTAHFSGLYMIQSWLCTVGGNTETVRWLGAGLTIIAAAALVWFILRHWRSAYAALPSPKASESPSRFAAFLAAVSLLAVIWAAVPLLLLRACSSHVG